MGRGSYPRVNSAPTVVQTVQSDLNTLNVAGGGTTTRSRANRCWTFELLDATAIVENVVVGTIVTGIPVGARIMVVCDLGTLGYAPPKAALAMQTAITSATLSGEVLANSQVRLCIS